jgi:exosome complex component RRP40
VSTVSLCTYFSSSHSCLLVLCYPSLLDPNHFFLPLLGSKFPLEVAVGVNGRVWIDAKDTRHTIAVVRCIQQVDPDGGGMDASNLKQFLGTLEL